MFFPIYVSFTIYAVRDISSYTTVFHYAQGAVKTTATSATAELSRQSSYYTCDILTANDRMSGLREISIRSLSVEIS